MYEGVYEAFTVSDHTVHAQTGQHRSKGLALHAQLPCEPDYVRRTYARLPNISSGHRRTATDLQLYPRKHDGKN